MKISIIVSIQICPGSPNHFGIGLDQELLHDLSDDKKNFKRVTKDQIVIMGRNTWDSIPERFRPLPNRRNIVISTTMSASGGVETYPSLEAALSAIEEERDELPREVFIIGGARLYAEALPIANRVYITMVKGEKPANVFFPKTNFEEEFPTVLTAEQRVDEQSQTEWTYLVAERN